MQEKREFHIEKNEDKQDMFSAVRIQIKHLKKISEDVILQNFRDGLDIQQLANNIETLLDVASIKINNSVKREARGRTDSKSRNIDALTQLRSNFNAELELHRQIIDQHQGIKGIIQNILNTLVSLINYCKTNKISFFVFDKTSARTTLDEIEHTLDETCTLALK